MTMPLETEIMGKIGFGEHFSWYNGSGSCKAIRQRAASKLEAAIQEEHNTDPTAIAPPDPRLIALLKKVAEEGDVSRYQLTRTWQAASNIIAAHIHQAQVDEEARQEAYSHLAQYIRRRYLPAVSSSS